MACGSSTSPASEELGTQNYLGAADLADFSASDFLLRVRNELHFLQGRPNDVMTLDLQRASRIAENLGYHDPEMLGASSASCDYYRAAQTIFRVSRLVEDRSCFSLCTAATMPLRETLLASGFPAPSARWVSGQAA